MLTSSLSLILFPLMSKKDTNLALAAVLFVKGIGIPNSFRKLKFRFKLLLTVGPTGSWFEF